MKGWTWTLQVRNATRWYTHQAPEEIQVWWIEDKHQNKKSWKHELYGVLKGVIIGFTKQSVFDKAMWLSRSSCKVSCIWQSRI